MNINEDNSPAPTRPDQSAAPTRQAQAPTHQGDDDQIIIVSEPPNPLKSLPPDSAATLAEIIRAYVDRHGLGDASTRRTTDDGT